MQVQKKDGSFEEFDRSKISGGVVKAGGSLDQGEMIAAQVENWAQGAAAEGMLRASDIRTKVTEFLQAANPEAGAAFGSYQKPK